MTGGWLAVRFLHVLAMALFIGGQLVLVAVSLAIVWLGLALAHGPPPFG